MVTLLMHLRFDWAVQALVIFSFMLQVILLSFASIRRHSVSIVPRLLLWLAYQLADSIALFTLGHMAISARPWEQQPLIAFWAPFLLVHLGGQDDITAYSFEDNRLWLRHLQTLLAQVMGASYVLYRYLAGKDILLMVAAVLIFVVGILKYGERIWALRSASLDTIWAGMDQKDEIISEREKQCNKLLFEALQSRWYMDAETVLIGAHGLLDVCVGLFIGLRRGRRDHVRHVLGSFRMYDRLDKLMEMELSLMYDILYTKATVIHTWCGCCIRVIALLATGAALLLFQLSSKDGHRIQDVAVTYVLLFGALLLEMVSAVKAAVSTWTRAILYSRDWRRLHGEVLSVRRFFGAAINRRWSGSIGQYNFLKACAHDTAAESGNPPGMATAKMLGLGQTAEDCWARLRHSRYASLSDTTKELVLREILGMGGGEHGDQIGSLRGLHTLKKHGLSGRLGWTILDVGFEESIMGWHLASDISLFKDEISDSDDDDDANLKAAIKVMSNYMMFLLVLRRSMLPGPVQRSRYEQARTELHSLMLSATESCKSSQDRLEWALRKGFHAHIHSEGPPALYDTGVRIADVLYHRIDRLQVIFGVWVEMLCYVASNCSRESHARQLSCGGELVTIVWLMARHVDLSS